MVRFLLIIGLLILPMLNNAQTADTNTPVTKTTWFWPLLSVGLVLLLSVPCTLIIIAIFCYMKNSSDDSDESTTDSNSSSSSSSVQRRAACLQSQRSHYAGGFRSPPPPYATNERPEILFLSPSPPPSYTSYLPENNSRSVSPNPARTTIINIEPAESIDNQSSITPEHGRTLDASSTLTNPSLQTFQV